jgi:hypothetical protein
MIDKLRTLRDEYNKLDEENKMLKGILRSYMAEYYEMYDGKFMDKDDENLYEELQEADRIRKEYSTGEFTQQEIADYYECSKHTIHLIVHNRIWTE